MAHDIQPPVPEQAGKRVWASERHGGYFAVVRTIDKFSEISGKAVAWLIVPMVLGLVFEVVSRYFFHAPTAWAFDVTYMLYGTLFMLGSAYTLRRGGHIRTDMLYRLWSPRVQGTVDAVCYVLFFFPGMLFFLFAGWEYSALSWAMQEKAFGSAWQPPIYPFKSVIPLTAVLMMIQGVSELIKSLHAATKGEWL
ncbi:MAG: TRAP transporter small permease subunit [Chloroflexota bacterium]